MVDPEPEPGTAKVIKYCQARDTRPWVSSAGRAGGYFSDGLLIFFTSTKT